MNFSKHLDQHDIFKKVASCVQEIGLESYIIGGYVRDLILDRSSKDIDFVCLGSGITLAQSALNSLQETFPVTELTVFKNFGTAMFKAGDFELEFVGARKESYQKDSRKPFVENGNLEDDQNRRDFTINSLAISLNKKNYGKLIDPFDGISDLKNKLIRTPLDPEVTFSDDPLRMMRAIRFAAQLEFDIAPDTFKAIQEQKERIGIVSQERITEELNKIILSKTPSYGFNLLFHSGLLEIIFPEMYALYGVDEIEGKKHKDNFYHTLKVLDNVAQKSDNLWLRWAAILHDIAKPPTKRFNKKVGWTFHGHEDKGAKMTPHIFRKLRLPSGEKMRFVQKLVKLHLRPIALVKKTITDSALRRLLFEAGNDLESLMLLCRADITSKNHELVKKYLNNFDTVEKKLKEVEARDKIANFQPVISGEIIMDTFALSPCKQVGIIKNKIRDAILDGKIRNEYQEAFDFMLEIAKEMNLIPDKKVG